jgi:hypothetical protein
MISLPNLTYRARPTLIKVKEQQCPKTFYVNVLVQIPSLVDFLRFLDLFQCYRAEVKFVKIYVVLLPERHPHYYFFTVIAALKSTGNSEIQKVI